MFIIVGLGNPGREYRDTRHNAGYMAVDILADNFDVEVNRHGFRAVYGEGFIDGKKAVLAKPETFMNLSGWSVMELCGWYKPEHGELVVIYDDADVPLGTIRIREGGSAGTHNGMRSVIRQLGYDDFPRVRIGIGKSGGRLDLAAYVLSAPAEGDRELFMEAAKDAADAARLIVRGEIHKAQALYNKKPKRLKEDGSQQAGALDSGEQTR